MGLRQLGFKVTQTPEGLYFEKAGGSGTYASASGLLRKDESWNTGELKRAYSEQVVESQGSDIWLASAMVYEQGRESRSNCN